MSNDRSWFSSRACAAGTHSAVRLKARVSFFTFCNLLFFVSDVLSRPHEWSQLKCIEVKSFSQRKLLFDYNQPRLSRTDTQEGELSDARGSEPPQGYGCRPLKISSKA